MRRSLTAVVVAAAAVSIIGSSAFAAGRMTAAKHSNTIHACVSKSGSLRLISGGAKCHSTEHGLAWNKRGRRGPAGPPGTPPPNSQVHTVGVGNNPAYGPFMQAYGSSTFEDLNYYRDSDGEVHLSGLACARSLAAPGCIDGTGFAGSQNVFQLPPGYRPARQHFFTALTYGMGAYYTARVDVDADGNVSLTYPPSSGFAFISFDQISFRAGA